METMTNAATSRQLWALYLASGKTHDYRNDNLTKEQASALLEEFNNKSGYKKESKPKAKAKSTPKESKPNKYGVKVGDIFHASWGYDQTNNDFFQVIALCGETFVRVREVHLKCISSRPTGPMAENRTFAVPNGEFAPYPERSSWIKDQENGDRKKITSWNKDGSNPSFSLASYANAYKCEGNTATVYESWYA